MDQQSNRGSQDRTRINIDQDHEVQYWTKEFGVSEEELRRAVQQVASSVEKVREHLKQAHH